MNLSEFDPNSGMPQRAHIERRTDVLTAMEVLLGAAHTDVRCMHHTLEPLGLSSISLVERLEKLLTTHRGARVRLLVDDTHWLDTQAPRLRSLHRLTTHALEIRQASPSDPVGDDAVAIVDHRHVLNLQIGKLVQGDLWLHHPINAQPWGSTFDRRWEHAGHNLPAWPLGL